MKNVWTCILCALILIPCALPISAAPVDLRSDTWTATDALGRKLPGVKECGPPRDGKFVGIFYFLWSGQHGTGGPYDITKIIAENPANPKWGPETAFHHWGESELGYYLSDDPYVIRKHARMLSQAGVDTLIFDVTNGITYLPVVLKICGEYTQMRAAGESTPQVCFLARGADGTVVNILYNEFYSKSLFSDLWFRWKGKPLIFTSPFDMRPEVRDFFNFRESWAWTSPDGWFGDGKDKWPWLDYYPQVPGWHEEGIPEEVAVSAAQHPTTTIGRSYHNGSEPAPANQHPAQGLYFAEQWKGALAIDPEFIFITGWNEWVAQRFLAQSETEGFAGRTLAKGDTYFVDAYSQEFSRDIEPMKGGHTDNYYYQMIDGIRRFKGVRSVEPAGNPKTIRIDGRFKDWTDVCPEFIDVTGDTKHRKSKGWGSAGTYINNTGRNDFTHLKVARDAKNLFFYAETKKDLTSFRDANWMLLFIDADCDYSTGWNGYDYLINNSVIDARNTTLSKWTNKGWERTSTVQYITVGNKLEIKVPKSALGFTGKPVALDIHWADNIRTTNDIIEFAVSGDSAPDRRFNYHYMSD